MAAPRDQSVRLHDILDAIAEANTCLGNASFETYMADVAMRRALERCVEIISEASRHVPAELKVLEPSIDWRRVAGIGNILRHDYAQVADDVIYQTAKHRLPELGAAARRLLAQVQRG